MSNNEQQKRSNIEAMKDLGPRWYIAHTYTGYESKVKSNIEKITEKRSLGNLIYDVKIPVVTSTVTNDKGEEKVVEEKLFPSYVFVKMTMCDVSWHVVRNITGVTGFVGPGSEPEPLTDHEIEQFAVEMPTEEFKFKVGDRVKVISGIFVGYSGILQEISEDQKQFVVLASTERRDIPIMVDAKDVSLDD